MLILKVVLTYYMYYWYLKVVAHVVREIRHHNQI